MSMFAPDPQPVYVPPAAQAAPPPATPTYGSAQQRATGNAYRNGVPGNSSILTSGAGLTSPANTARKSLLGQ